MPNGPAGSRVALVHDFLLDLRGAERVFLSLCDAFPEADVFTAVYDEDGTEGRFAGRTVRTTFLQALRPTARSFRALLPFDPAAMESLDLRGYDVVLSSSSAWAHGVIPEESAVHVCYCHNPFRYAWNARDETLARRDPVSRAALRVIFQRWRQWDWIAAQRVDAYVANSATTRLRIERFFNRDAEILHPPVQTARFAPGTAGDAYVILSELVPHKHIDVAVEAFNRLGRPLLIVGDGPDERRLRRLAGPTVRFAGRLSDAEVAAALRSAKALVVTAKEEFGIAAVEAQAAGRPVIALDEGGVRETVLDGLTGTFYPGNDPGALAAAVARFDADAVDPRVCVDNAERYDEAHFRHGIRAIVERARQSDRPLRGARRRPPLRARGLAGQAP
jgi:glycosyltransferase involved in cell wall biosynthesis